MTYRVITVVFTRRKLSALEIAEQKKYLFICEHRVKIGDIIDNAKKIYPALELMLAYKICNFQLAELNPKTFAMRVELPNSDGIMLIMSAPFYKGDIIQYTLKVHRVEEN